MFFSFWIYESLRNGGVVNEDRISDLPEALLLQILSLLQVKDVVSTSVLSKSWRSLWKLVPKLKFYYPNNQSEQYRENFCRILVSNKAPFLESLHLCFSFNSCSSMDVGMWIGIAYARHVRELVLHVVSEKYLSFQFPKSLYNCETLETLTLKGWIHVNAPSPVCLKSLRTLRLENMDYNYDHSVINLFSGCPKLENLVVYRRNLLDVKTFTIAVPSLQRLTIYDDNDAKHCRGYVINAPSLKYLKIDGFKALESCLIENAPELVEAKVINVSKIINEKLLESLTSVKRLSLALSPLEIKYPTGRIFYQLVSLELYTNKAEWWNLLVLMLDSSPKLQVLKLIGKWYGVKNHLAIRNWNQPKNVPGCLLFHLETFMWKGCKRLGEDEKEVAKYILRNSNRLKRATFTIKIYEENDSPDMVEVVEELKSVVMASNSCQLVFKETDSRCKY
ncbi:F-box/LRR-repeat protein At3g26922-like [Arabidopsis lyrata subsp. lyrata]|uniref:F-box/LRR-repeat protein At3g26922-like n=1 Tax=Arabidopsis lyrata subsp. lyrata TaxID=81972 RepID=UPI000A29C2F2|nr:F-box/LRR-repeat protein At3g26922-like [Arabidopsis lyrata subsp. lyrata]|eukprot:XP_020881406.1 F-box/LRR-repeat protein At3g26922-like [Arabidopsis lyrata subsp. lyrata]